MADLRGQRVLVTGADGFIGSHLTEALVRHGCRVRAMVFYNATNSFGWLEALPAEILDAAEVVAGDVRDALGMRRAVEGCRAVFHLAALVSVPHSYEWPSSYVETNVHGSLNVFQAALDAGVERVVHSSTSEIYGTPRTVPITEEHPVRPQSPYAASKAAADQMAHAYHASFGLPVVTVRPFNTYGARQSARAVIPAMVIQLANGNRRVRLGSLKPTRDFNAVADVARGFLRAAEAEGVVGEVIQLGTGSEVSIGQMLGLIAGIMGVEPEIELDPVRVRPPESEVERLVADNRKARRLLGWEPELQGLEGLELGLRDTVAWLTRPENLSRYKAERYNV